MVCQKLCQNRVSGWGSLEESVLIFLREHSSFEFWIIAIRSGKSTTSCRGNRFFFNAGKWLSMGSRLWTVCRLWWNRCQLGVLRTASVTVGNPNKKLLGGLVTWILWLSIYILGISSSQLTNSYFSEGLTMTTNQRNYDQYLRNKLISNWNGGRSYE